MAVTPDVEKVRRRGIFLLLRTERSTREHWAMCLLWGVLVAVTGMVAQAQVVWTPIFFEASGKYLSNTQEKVREVWQILIATVREVHARSRGHVVSYRGHSAGNEKFWYCFRYCYRFKTKTWWVYYLSVSKTVSWWFIVTLHKTIQELIFNLIHKNVFRLFKRTLHRNV